MTIDPRDVSLHTTHAYPSHKRAVPLQRAQRVAVQAYRAPVSRMTALATPPALIGTYLTVELTGTTGATFTGTPVQARPPLPLAG